MEHEPIFPFEIEPTKSPEIDPLTGKKKKKKTELFKKPEPDPVKPAEIVIGSQKDERVIEPKTAQPEPQKADSTEMVAVEPEEIEADVGVEQTQNDQHESPEQPIAIEAKSDEEPEIEAKPIRPRLSLTPDSLIPFEAREEEIETMAPAAIVSPAGSVAAPPPLAPTVHTSTLPPPPSPPPSPPTSPPRPPLGPTIGGGNVLPPTPNIAPNFTPNVLATPIEDQRRVLGSLLIGALAGGYYEHRKHKKREKRKAREHRNLETQHSKLRKDFENEKFANKTSPAVEVFKPPGIEREPSGFEPDLAKLQKERARPPAEILLSDQRFEKEMEKEAVEVANPQHPGPGQAETVPIKTERDIEIHQEIGLEHSLPSRSVAKTASLAGGGAPTPSKDLGRFTTSAVSSPANLSGDNHPDSNDNQDFITEPAPQLAKISAGILGAILLIIILLLALL